MNYPSHWTISKLPEVVYFQEGPGLRKYQYRDSGIPFLNIRTLVNEKVDLSLCKFLDEKEVEARYRHFLLDAGDIICSTSGTLGKTAIIREQDLPLMLNTSVIRFRTLDQEVLLQKFIYFYLKSENFLRQAIGASTGSAQVNVGPSHLKTFDIPIPPFNEQKRISEKLDSLIARVDSCKSHLERIPQILKRFRQSVLAAATSGRLSEDWREEKGVNDEWEPVQLSEVATSRLGKMLDAAKNRGELHPYLRNINVRWFAFDLSDIQELRISEEEAKALGVRKGDVLVCEGGEPGRCAVWYGEDDVYLFQKALHRVRVGQKLLPQWLCYCLKLSADSGKLADYFTGTTIKHFTGVSLSRFEFYLPSLEEQAEIVRRVENLFAYADRLEENYLFAIKRVQQLTPSLLAKAFRGELVEQDPNDEPASVLLERIRSQREEELSKESPRGKKPKQMQMDA